MYHPDLNMTKLKPAPARVPDKKISAGANRHAEYDIPFDILSFTDELTRMIHSSSRVGERHSYLLGFGWQHQMLYQSVP